LAIVDGRFRHLRFRAVAHEQAIEKVACGACTRSVLSRREAHALRDSTPGRGLLSTPNVVVLALIRFVEDSDHLVARQLDFRPIPVQRFGANDDVFRVYRNGVAKNTINRAVAFSQRRILARAPTPRVAHGVIEPPDRRAIEARRGAAFRGVR
jgi:hypothetical protein